MTRRRTPESQTDSDTNKMTPVNDTRIEGWRTAALAYLRENLRERAPAQLGKHHVFEESPLEGEGPVALFEFSLASGSATPERFFVATGQTEPNYYAALELVPEDMYALHLGTRFMLVLGVGLAADTDRSRINLDKAVRDLVWSIRPGELVSGIEWAAAFDVDGQLHGVTRCRIGQQPAYAFVGDAPPGFSTQVDIAPQIAYRIHLGRALLAEMDRNSDEADEAQAPLEDS